MVHKISRNFHGIDTILVSTESQRINLELYCKRFSKIYLFSKKKRIKLDSICIFEVKYHKKIKWKVLIGGGRSEGCLSSTFWMWFNIREKRVLRNDQNERLQMQSDSKLISIIIILGLVRINSLSSNPTSYTYEQHFWKSFMK